MSVIVRLADRRPPPPLTIDALTRAHAAHDAAWAGYVAAFRRAEVAVGRYLAVAGEANRPWDELTPEAQAHSMVAAAALGELGWAAGRQYEAAWALAVLR